MQCERRLLQAAISFCALLIRITAKLMIIITWMYVRVDSFGAKCVHYTRMLRGEFMTCVTCRNAGRKLLYSLTLVLLISVSARAQDAFEEAVKQLSSDNVRGYIQPFVNAFGANLNSGVYHSASAAEGF